MALIKFKKDWHAFRAGQEIELGDGVADVYVNHSHVAEYVTAAKPATASNQPAAKPKGSVGAPSGDGNNADS